MTAKIIPMGKTAKGMIAKNNVRETKSYEEERLLAAGDSRLSPKDREALAENLYQILESHEKKNPSFKAVQLMQHMSDDKTFPTKQDFYRFKNCTTKKPDSASKRLRSSAKDYICWIEALIAHSNKQPKQLFEQLARGTSFHGSYTGKGALTDSKKRATVFYRRLMKAVKRLDEKYNILDTYREINEQVIKNLNRGAYKPWPQDEWFVEDIKPRYEVMLSDIGISKSFLKKYTSGDMWIEQANLDEFDQETQQIINDACREHILIPEQALLRAKQSMELYHFHAKEPEIPPEHLLKMPRYYLGDIGDRYSSLTWKEVKASYGSNIQRHINNPDPQFESVWYYFFIYPAPDGCSLQVRLHGSPYVFEELSEDTLLEFFPRQVYPPNKRWRENQTPLTLEEYLFDPKEEIFQQIIRSFEATVVDLKNHPLLVVKQNLEKATEAFILKFKSELHL